MALDLEEKPGNQQDDNWKPTQDDSDESSSASTSELSDLENSSGGAEDSSKSGSKSTEELRGSESSVGDKLGKGFTTAVPQAALAQRIAGLLSTKKRKGAAGGIIGGIISVFVVSIFSGSLELVHLRENMLGEANKLVNHSLQQRRVASFKKIAKKLNQGNLQGRLTKGPEKLKAKFKTQGFVTEFDKDGKLQKISYTSAAGETKAIDFNNSKKDINAQSKEFFNKGKFGREASRKYDVATRGKAQTWKGAATRSFYRKFHVSFKNWVDRKSSQKNQKDKFADNLQAKEREDNGTHARTKGPTDTGSGNENPPDQNGNSVNSPGDDSVGSAGDVSSSTDPVHLPDESVSPDKLGGSLGSLLKLGPNDIADSAIKGLSITGGVQTACSISRTIEMARKLRNISVVMQLMRFSYNFLTVADSQKADVVSSDGIALMATYINSTNKDTGKTGINSGGVQGTILGKSGAHPSAANIAKYGSSHKHQGVLASVEAVLSKFGVGNGGNSGTCKVVDNGFVQIGSLTAGVALAFLTGGTITAGQIAQQAALGVASFTAKYYAKQALFQSATGIVLSGYENGEQAGDALASGWGSARGMGANINGLRPIKKADAAEAEKLALLDSKEVEQTKGFTARYFDTGDTQSLVSRVAQALPIHMTISDLLSSLPRIFGAIASSFNRLFFPLSYAATADESQCNDVMPKTDIKIRDVYKIDDFCNPEVAASPQLDIGQTEPYMDQTERVLLNHTVSYFSIRYDAKGNPICDVPHTVAAPLIQPDGAPISYPDGQTKLCSEDPPIIKMSDDIVDFAARQQDDENFPKPECLSGRIGIFYAPYKKDPGKNNDTTIDDPSRIIEHRPNPGSGPANTDQTYENVCLEDGQPLENDNVGRFLRYAAWYGYLVDEQNFVEESNGEYNGAAPISFNRVLQNNTPAWNGNVLA